eukprot:664261-Rhodomonas_salina.1
MVQTSFEQGTNKFQMEYRHNRDFWRLVQFVLAQVPWYSDIAQVFYVQVDVTAVSVSKLAAT